MELAVELPGRVEPHQVVRAQIVDDALEAGCVIVGADHRQAVGRLRECAQRGFALAGDGQVHIQRQWRADRRLEHDEPARIDRIK